MEWERLIVKSWIEGMRKKKMVKIVESDLKNVFEKGFTGSNHHNGKYKSTGMGLYLAHLIMKKLGHTITVESEFGCFTRVILGFRDNRDYFQL